MNEIMIKARGLKKIYANGQKSLTVLNGIDLDIKKGDFVSIAGPSGAGKSTLLHLLGALDEPSEGKIFLDGEDIYALSGDKRAQIRNRKVGFVFQFYHLLAEFSVLENVMLPSMIAGCGRGKIKEAKALLEELGLADRISHKPAELSGGEQQRVAITRALINNPEILFCDEPTGNLDSKNGEKIIELLVEMNKKDKVTILLVTHSEKLAEIADTKYHIKDGRFV